MQESWYPITDFYEFDRHQRCRHRKDPPNKWIRLSCVYKLRIGKKIIHVGRSDTCRKHGGAEKVRKAIIQLLGITGQNPAVAKTKMWEQLRLRYQPSYFNIELGIIETKNVAKVYAQELEATNKLL